MCATVQIRPDISGKLNPQRGSMRNHNSGRIATQITADLLIEFLIWKYSDAIVTFAD
jgi:hypothetical protein